MNNSKNLFIHYLVLAGVIALGTILRFWNLDLKPLWLDEVLTALLSLGRRYKDVPLEVGLPVSTLQQLLTLQPNVSNAEIAQAVATQSTHPPLFFCLMHQWLKWVEPLGQSLYWKLRALPALFGVGTIAAIYCLNRVAFSPTAALMGATLMAISPFGVYLSQEARHYTVPMLFITLALLGLIQIQQALYTKRQLPQPLVWVLWGVVNSIGCYIHYFCAFAFIAQLLTLIGLMYWRRQMLPRGSFLAVSLVVIGVAVSYLPWLPVLLGSFGRAETGWLPKPQNIAPLFQTLVIWVSIAIALPVENQPLWIQVPAVLLTIGFSGWLGWQVWRGFKQLWKQPETHIETFTLLSFTLCVLLQFFALIYLLGKDITVAPRYNFVYYPAIYALLGASLVSRRLAGWQGGTLQVKRSQGDRQTFKPSTLQRLTSSLQPRTLVLAVSLLSCVFVVSNLVFIKPFHPQKVAQDMKVEPAVPVMMVMGYHSFQDVALGMSFALALDKLNLANRATGLPAHSKGTANDYVAFLHPEQSYHIAWQKLAQLPALPVPRLNLWVVAPGLRDEEFPPQLAIAGKTSCTNDPTQHHRIGIPYQLYRCQ
ncbi:MAG: glycosyltransferase family 39 protein [Coleofasciculus sp. Co-bin14]|nr:glycosyltransferase family 39 protein [Coleofasciculus sp. Co-bin14]